MKQKNLINKALILAVFTILYNLAEGFISVLYGIEDETLSLLGFGIDSFVEVISGIGILHLVLRMKNSEVCKRDKFERLALKITAGAFFILALGLIVSSVFNIVQNNKPETTIVGVIISVVSILIMYFLMKAKLKVGKELHSDAIIADANCTKTCFYLSFVLLFSSVLYEVFHIAYFDIAGSLFIAYFAFTEGKEALEKSKSETLSCSCG